METIAKTCGILLRSLRAEAREADFVASTEAVDSYGEVVEQTWRLDRFRVNPIVLWGHQSRDLPIGVCTSVGVKNGALECTIRFLTADKNPKAEQVWRMVRDGELKAVSVGFMPNTVRLEKRNELDVYVLGDNELHEISVCTIPANPEALAKMKSKALVSSRSAESATHPARAAAARGDGPSIADLLDPPMSDAAALAELVELGFATDDIERPLPTTRRTPPSGDLSIADVMSAEDEDREPDLSELYEQTMGAGGLEDGPSIADLMGGAE